MAWSRRKIEGTCGAEGCTKPLKAKGLCETHYQMNRKYGRTTRILKLYDGDLCAEVDCKSPARACGYCRAHYKIARREGRLHPDKYKRDHPLYGLWWHRRKAAILSDEWKDDFLRFVSDIGQKPGKFFTLVTLRDGPFGPDNFEWHEQIKRKPGESREAFWARKWQHQKAARPSWDRHRRIKKKYGLTPEEYVRMSAEQNGLCATCGKPETSVNSRGSKNSLAIDHCHSSGVVRGLLCIRCNLVIGRIEESVETLRAMISYLERYSKPKESP